MPDLSLQKSSFTCFGMFCSNVFALKNEKSTTQPIKKEFLVYISERFASEHLVMFHNFPDLYSAIEKSCVNTHD